MNWITITNFIPKKQKNTPNTIIKGAKISLLLVIAFISPNMLNFGQAIVKHYYHIQTLI